jgi:hypothetical protein
VEASGKYTAKLKARLKAGNILTVYDVDKAGNQSTGTTMRVLDKTANATGVRHPYYLLNGG